MIRSVVQISARSFHFRSTCKPAASMACLPLQTGMSGATPAADVGAGQDGKGSFPQERDFRTSTSATVAAIIVPALATRPRQPGRTPRASTTVPTRPALARSSRKRGRRLSRSRRAFHTCEHDNSCVAACQAQPARASQQTASATTLRGHFGRRPNWGGGERSGSGAVRSASRRSKDRVDQPWNFPVRTWLANPWSDCPGDLAGSR